MIYAWNDADPSDNGSPNYHMSNRGSMGVTFVETSQVVDDLDKAETISLVQRDVRLQIHYILFKLYSLCTYVCCFFIVYHAYPMARQTQYISLQLR